MCSLCPDSPWPDDTNVSTFHCAVCGVLSAPHQSCDCGKNERSVTDLEAYEAIEAGLEPVDPHAQVTCEKHNQTYALFSNDYCTECAQAEGWFYPYWVEGDKVTAYGKPGTVRWVTPWDSVAVVFEDGQMLWFAGEDVGQIGERE
jgi:hypothetical protein